MSKLASVLDRYPQYEATIGIEVHCQLTTNTKIFCTCANEITDKPNYNICQICTGQPGVLPVLNKQVVEYAIMAGLATNCTISEYSEFARKHYFYPDLPKGYQITQHTDPICVNGYVPIRLEDGSIKKIRLMRIHIEEDAGKNIHAPGTGESFVDLNRAGTPLLEIVTYPDISNADEAKKYLQALRLIVQYLGICSGNMEEGAFRADTNVSVRKKGAKELGTRCELKNINSFKFISDAVEYELQRHIDIIEDGGKVLQQTRLWDTVKNESKPMRSKEEAADYRYFPDPDLPLVRVESAAVDNVRKNLPELPEAKFNRLVSAGLSEYEAEILINDLALADYYEKAHKINPSKQVVNWILRDIMGLLKDQKIEIDACKITPEKLAALVTLLDEGKINNKAAREVFAEIAQTGKNPEEIVKELGLEQIGSSAELEAIVLEIIKANPGNVQEFKSGKDRLMGFFVGQAMQKTKGKGDPKLLQELFVKHLS